MRCCQRLSGCSNRFSSASNRGWTTASGSLPRNRGHARNNHEQRLLLFCVPKRCPVCPASSWDGRGTPRARGRGTISAQQSRAGCQRSEFVSYSLSGVRGKGYQSSVASFAFFFRCHFLWELRHQPPQNLNLICSGCPTDLDEQLLQVWSNERRVLGAFVAHGTDRAKVRQIVASAFAPIDDVAYVKTHFARAVIRMDFSSSGSTHLASEPIAVQDKRPSLL